MSENKVNVTYTYFLLDFTYNISHILSKFIHKEINLIYLAFKESEPKMFQFMYIQDCSLKHITRLGLNYKVSYVLNTEMDQYFKNNSSHIFLNHTHELNSSNHVIQYPKNIKEVTLEEAINENVNISKDSNLWLKNVGHGYDEEDIIILYGENYTKNIKQIMVENINSKVKINLKNIDNIQDLDKKAGVFQSIYNLDKNKETILYLDNFLYPFIKNRDSNCVYDNTITNKIITQLIELKKTHNVIIRFHPFNEYGIKVDKEFPQILLDNFFIDFTPFETAVMYKMCDIVISNRYTSTGLESLFFDCKSLFIEYDFDKRKFPKEVHLHKYTNEIFGSLLNSGYIVNNSIIPVVKEDNLDLIDIIRNNKFYKNINEYKKIYCS